jgi:anionic cell wall polymer biosynthesis LytR-Cps2A-Psr (LCP) family protein
MSILNRAFRRLALPLALVTALSATLVNPQMVGAMPAPPDRRSADGLLDVMLSIAAPGATLIDQITGSQAVSNGSDGRLTFLLLGSDSRGSAISRTDTIMVVSLKGKSISMASIPRDTGRIPNPSGGTFAGKVNGLVRSFMLGGMTRDAALARFENVIEYVMGIEIDYRAVIWFDGLTTLVGRVDPIFVSIPREIRDPKQVDDPDREWGVYFPQNTATTYALYDYNNRHNTANRPLCNGLYKSDSSPPVNSAYHCHRALPFVRSRKGPNNDDWIRARRQQHFVFRAIKAITSQAELDSLYATAASQGMGRWITNMPMSLSNARDLYSRLIGSVVSAQVVFKPTTWAKKIPGTSSYELRLPEVRQWANTNMS